MISLKDWMELVDYKITEGSEYCWSCYGYHAHQLGTWNGIHGKGGHSSSIIFDTENQTVYEVEFCDYTNDRAYRMINPDFKDAHIRESKTRDIDIDEAWDGVQYVDLEVDDDFIQKGLAIKKGLDYDTRVSVPVEFSDEDLLTYMKMAHERDITFNQLIEEALITIIEKHKHDLA